MKIASAITPMALMLTSVAFAQSPSAPPPTRVDPVTDTIHGVEVVDPYRWLEGDNSDPANMGKVNDEVSAWTDAQNAHTRNLLDNLPGRKTMEDTLRP